MKKVFQIFGIVLFVGIVFINTIIINKNNSGEKVNFEVLNAQAQPGVEFVQAYQCWKWYTGGLATARLCTWCGYMPFVTGFIDSSCHY